MKAGNPLHRWMTAMKSERMKPALQDRLLRRELGHLARYSKVRGIYGDAQFVDDLDIVNELNGHSGCINALR